MTTPNTQGGGGQGGTGTTTPPGDAANGGGGGGSGSRYGDRREAVQGIVDRLALRHGSVERALEVLAGDNYDLREERRTLTTRVADLETKQVPAGAVVLTADADKASWEKVKALNLPGDKIAERVKRADELELTVTTQQRKAHLGDVAGTKALQWNVDVLETLIDQNKLETKVESVTVRDAAGKETPEKVAYVRKAGDANAAWEKLSDLTTRDGSPFKLFLSSLKANAGGGQNGQGNQNGQSGQGGTTTPVVGSTVTFPDQSGGSSTTETTSVVDAALKRASDRAERPNPLRPAKAKA